VITRTPATSPPPPPIQSNALASATTGTEASRHNRRTASTMAGERLLDAIPGPTTQAVGAVSTQLSPRQGRTITDGNCDATGPQQLGSVHKVTSPGLARCAPLAANTAAPWYPSLPATNPTCPKVPLCPPSGRRGGNPEKSAASTHRNPPGTSSPTNPMSDASSNRPTQRAAVSRNKPRLTAPNVTVTQASTVSPIASPVSALSPEGTSTDTTPMPDPFTARINSPHSPSTGRFKPMPNNPSTTSASRLPSCRASHSLAREKERADPNRTVSVLRSVNPRAARAASLPLCPRPTRTSTGAPGRVHRCATLATAAPARACTDRTNTPVAQVRSSRSRISATVITRSAMSRPLAQRPASASRLPTQKCGVAITTQGDRDRQVQAHSCTTGEGTSLEVPGLPNPPGISASTHLR
jgi:hypothetical protein